jgi:hypothetical protein
MSSPLPSSPFDTLLRRYRLVLGFFILALVASGITAFPLEGELEVMAALRGVEHLTPEEAGNGFDHWILTVRNGLRDTNQQYPWLAYGTDWLAFAHLTLAVFFIGPFRDPVRNVWVIQAGLIACLLVIPLAMICGPIRGIPFWWRMIDCSFGVFGAIPLFYCLKLTRQMERSLPAPVHATAA